MNLQNIAAVLILLGIGWLATHNGPPDTPEQLAARQEAKAAQTARYNEVAAQVSALPGFWVPSGQAAGVMRIVTTQPLSDYDARKFCQRVQAQLGEGIMVRLVDDTGHILATRY
jgi:hypothetical protein